MNYHGKIEETDTLIGNMGLGVDYYKGEQGIPGKDGKDGSDQVYVGADEPTDERVKLWIDTDATPPSKTVSWDEIENKPEIPAPYTLPTASTSTLGGVKVDGNTITITDGVISSVGSAEPDAYIKDASVSGNTLTLTKKDDTNVVFTPSGGSSGGGVSGYAFSSSQTFTDEDKLHLKEVYMGKNVYMTIDNLTVIRIMSFGSRWGFAVVNTNGASSNQVQIYSIDIDSNGNIISDTFTLFMSYYLVGNSSALSLDWQATSNASESNLYNATEMVLYWTDNNDFKNQTYLNFTANFNLEVGQTLGTGWVEQPINIDVGREITFNYDGSSINLYNSKSLDFILYKT